MAIFNVTNSDGVIHNFNSWITSITGTLDGDLLIYGNFTTYSGDDGAVSANGIIKLDYNGVVQPDFDYGTGFSSNTAFSQTGATMDASGDFYIGGQFTQYDGTAAKNIVKLSADGTIDTSFVYGTGIPDNYSLRPLVTSGGLIFYPGRGTTYNGTTMNRYMKVSALGAIDTAYDTNVGAGANNTVIQALDGGAGITYIHGYFTTFAGTTVNHITKLSAAGIVDSTFDSNVGTGFNNATANNFMDGIVDSNGAIVMVGLFTDYNGTTVGQIARLSSAGVLDTTFNTAVGTGFTGGRPYYISEGSGATLGKYLISGDFTHYQGSPVNGTILINNDGTLNTGFNFTPIPGFGYEEAERIGSYWYAASPNYATFKYYLVRIDDNGLKTFL